MKILFYIPIFVAYNLVAQQPKKLTEKFFPDFDIEIPTPAFQKKKGFTKYHEMMDFLNDFIKKSHGLCQMEFIGTSQNGFKIPILYFSNSSKKEKIKVFFMGGLHGNEPASTEGMLFLISKLISADTLEKMLSEIDLAILPMANIDGYQKQDRYAKNGLDLNRDQTKLIAPESVLIKKTVNKFNPDVVVDFHEYKPYRADFVHFGSFGITQKYDAMFLYSGNLNVSPSIRNITENLFVKNAQQVLDKNNLTHHNYFRSKKYNKKLQFNLGGISPRSSATNYALANCISILMEIRGVGLDRVSFNRRVMTTFLLANSYLETTLSNSEKIKSAIEKAKKFSDSVVVRSYNTKEEFNFSTIDVYERKYIEIPIEVNNALKSNPSKKRKRPTFYIIDPKLEKVAEKLELLGLDISKTQAEKMLNVEIFNIESVQNSNVLFEGFYPTVVSASTKTENISIPKGAFVVNMNQKKSNLAVETLEPEAIAGFVRYNVISPEETKYIYRFHSNISP